MDDTHTAIVSTGGLPGAAVVERLVDSAHERFGPVRDGRCSDVYPALERADPELFGICVCSVDGDAWTAGDALVEFTIMSVAKPFTFALVREALGHDEARRLLGVNATGHPFNSVEAVERSGDGRTNPMVNAGALAAVSLVPGDTVEQQWENLRDGLSRFAGRELVLDDEVLASAAATNSRNGSIAHLVRSMGALHGDPAEVLDLYTRQSCLAVTAEDLATMGATLADGGVNPRTGERVVSAAACRDVLAVMTIAGLYETSGDWLYRVGLPGKSGIGGGIVTVSPGKGGLGTFSPPLDAAGNSVRGTAVAEDLSRRLGLDILASAPAGAR